MCKLVFQLYLCVCCLLLLLLLYKRIRSTTNIDFSLQRNKSRWLIFICRAAVSMLTKTKNQINLVLFWLSFPPIGCIKLCSESLNVGNKCKRLRWVAVKCPSLKEACIGNNKNKSIKITTFTTCKTRA